MTGPVLVTGGFGLVGSATVRRLAELGRRTVVADLDTPSNRKAAETLPPGVTVQWADLTNADRTAQLVSEVAPEAIIHLAAIIPPTIYRIDVLPTDESGGFQRPGVRVVGSCFVVSP